MYDKLLPDDPADWLATRVRNVVWADDPRDQMSESLLLFIIALVSNFVTLGATVVLAIIFLFFFAIGATRFAVHQAT